MNKELIKILKHRHKVLAKKAPPDFKKACNEVYFALGQYLNKKFTKIKTLQYLNEKKIAVNPKYKLIISIYDKVLNELLKE